MSAVSVDFFNFKNIMTKTREQKEQAIDTMKEMLSDKKGFIAFGFTGASVNDLNQFRGDIIDVGGDMRVVKRRLLDIALEDENINFELEKFIGQTGFVTFSSSLPDIANVLFDIKNYSEDVKVFGGYDLKEGALVEAGYIEEVGNLPSREVLLGQVVGAIGAPITAFMQTLKERAKKVE